MDIQEVLSAPRSPWQRAYIERVIGTIRRECLDHVIVFNEASLYRHVKSFVTYYHESLISSVTKITAAVPSTLQSCNRRCVASL